MLFLFLHVLLKDKGGTSKGHWSGSQGAYERFSRIPISTTISIKKSTCGWNHRCFESDSVVASVLV
jgi:hypothetical protein